MEYVGTLAASAALMEELIPRYLDPEAYAVINGGVDQTTVLLQKHSRSTFKYTGSGDISKIVAGASAKTLTPTTLELGCKSSVIVEPDAGLKMGYLRVLPMKSLNLGQERDDLQHVVCVTPDYILVIKQRVDDFVKEIVATRVYSVALGSTFKPMTSSEVILWLSSLTLKHDGASLDNQHAPVTVQQLLEHVDLSSYNPISFLPSPYTFSYQEVNGTSTLVDVSYNATGLDSILRRQDSVLEGRDATCFKLADASTATFALGLFKRQLRLNSRGQPALRAILRKRFT
ncbi:uncharacterized protein EHS24_002424 [Apiotrichum porosum]|uniref:Aldehyde dehydrogenase domain-containing protein n=1 Tax=Apiotrichum porosum TaxID=105984 RepID=A0A427XIH9_9TREE|nr:uncharacterized protein EHS24_002424 [Apiotrichum porosum]RSH78695.1 hypothetical protein EHS24_002424 [Apiotrichum porosum]